MTTWGHVWVLCKSHRGVVEGPSLEPVWGQATQRRDGEKDKLPLIIKVGNLIDFVIGYDPLIRVPGLIEDIRQYNKLYPNSEVSDIKDCNLNLSGRSQKAKKAE